MQHLCTEGMEVLLVRSSAWAVVLGGQSVMAFKDLMLWYMASIVSLLLLSLAFDCFCQSFAFHDVLFTLRKSLK